MVRVVAWAVVAATSVHGFGAALFDTYQSGWPAVNRPAQSVGFHLYQNWREWSAGLDRPAEPLRPALPMNLPLAAFHRQQPLRLVAPLQLSRLTAERAVDAVHAGEGWLIVPAAKFAGREGLVMVARGSMRETSITPSVLPPIALWVRAKNLCR